MPKQESGKLEVDGRKQWIVAVQFKYSVKVRIRWWPCEGRAVDGVKWYSEGVRRVWPFTR